jgi:predicted DNA-binding ribbon-helix-helix protein
MRCTASIRRNRLTGLVKRSFSLAGHRTSVALEAEFWAVLLRMADANEQSLSGLVAAVDSAREPDQPLASALRVTALRASQATPSKV